MSLRPQHCTDLFILIRLWIQFLNSAVEIDFSASNHTVNTLLLTLAQFPFGWWCFFFVAFNTYVRHSTSWTMERIHNPIWITDEIHILFSIFWMQEFPRKDKRIGYKNVLYIPAPNKAITKTKYCLILIGFTSILDRKMKRKKIE